MAIKLITLPDIGDFDAVEVIEVLVNVGDQVAVDDPLITLESDKASMEIPSTISGIVEKLNVKVGDSVSKGDLILILKTIDGQELEEEKIAEPKEHLNHKKDESSNQKLSENQVIEPISIPDIGDFDAVEVIEVLVNVGDKVTADDPIITLESDKASMEIPTPKSGVITKINVKVGDKVSKGDEMIHLETIEDSTKEESKNDTINSTIEEEPKEQKTEQQDTTSNTTSKDTFASPSVRKLSRELEIDLSMVPATGDKGRITDTDLRNFVKNAIKSTSSSTGSSSSSATSSSGGGIPDIPSIDFAKFGEVEEVELMRINKISGKHLHACWLNIPHVTQFDEANINELESFRKVQKDKGNKFTPIVFIIKAVVRCMKLHPRFNSSLAGDKLILKKYFNIGVAVDTPNGLMVPVIKDCDKKSITELQAELIGLAEKAREGKLSSTDLQGACFTISSLGGIGGTKFTPIVNAPEVAILGVSKAQVKPIWNGSEFVPTTMLPLSLSYDHRVIDGALGARFITDLSSVLKDIREVLL